MKHFLLHPILQYLLRILRCLAHTAFVTHTVSCRCLSLLLSIPPTLFPAYNSPTYLPISTNHRLVALDLALRTSAQSPTNNPRTVLLPIALVSCTVPSTYRGT
ncbi:hypothetical protein C8F01DRAFT_550734 [Mycena amicta]|nr:hypothetical protein C8F01DRAFT_550734 [Mycena amicta]